MVLPNLNTYSIYHTELCRQVMGKLLYTQSHIDRTVVKVAINEIISILSLACNKIESNIPEKAILDRIIISSDLKYVTMQLFLAVLTGAPTHKYTRMIANQYFVITLFFFGLLTSCLSIELFFSISRFSIVLMNFCTFWQNQNLSS